MNFQQKRMKCSLWERSRCLCIYSYFRESLLLFTFMPWDFTDSILLVTWCKDSLFRVAALSFTLKGKRNKMRDKFRRLYGNGSYRTYNSHDIVREHSQFHLLLIWGLLMALFINSRKRNSRINKSQWEQWLSHLDMFHSVR